ncbi:MAG: hypothetical protein JO019_00330 [Candidatus Kaiserbacteria bacterium]|nr:hypothetical protein [Candidatus Kaiserbacteria bacterium]
MSDLQNVKISRDDARWETEIKAEIPAEALSRYRDLALKEIQKTAKLDGFRPGKAPLERIVQVYGESAVMRHAAEHAIEHELPELLAKENVLIVESPRVSTDTPENGKPLVFTARAALAPEVTLPDYKAIAKKHVDIKEDTSVSDEEHRQALMHLRRERARIDKIESGTEPQKAAEESRAMEEKDLPELDDAFVQSLGIESAEKFIETVRTNIKTEKEIRAMEKRRAAILDELAKETKARFPAALAEYELDDMEGRLKDDLARIGQTLESYLAEAKKTLDELRASWKEAAENRAKVRLILAEIARKENIQIEPAVLEHELEHARQHYPDADAEALRSHILHAMRNEATLRFLEGNTEPVGHTAHDHE